MSRIKEAFVSRWGKDGVILECDLSQIEVVVLAFQSQDPQMIADVLAGVDFHCKRLAAIWNEPYEDVLLKCKGYGFDEHTRKYEIDPIPRYVKGRKDAKGIQFKKQYGGGAKSIAEETGLDLKIVKEFIKADDEMYPGVVALHNSWIEEVEQNKRSSQERTYLGFPAKKSFYTSITGARYGFVEQDVPKNMQQFAGFEEALRHNPNLNFGAYKLYGQPRQTGFKPTTIKNWMTQGLAGEVLYLILGEIGIQLLNDDRLCTACLPINTVHDSEVFDVKRSVVEKASNKIKGIFESAPILFEKAYGVEFNLPIRCEIEYGDNWGMKK